MEEKRLDARPLIKNPSVLEMSCSEKKPTRTSSMTNNEEDEQIKGDQKADDIKIDIPDHMDDGCSNPHPISPERNQQRQEEQCPATPKPEEASSSSRQVIKSHIAIAIAFLALSGAAIFGGLHDRIGNETSRFIHKDRFKACSYSLYAMFFSSDCLLILSFNRRRYNKVLDQLVRLSICGALGSVSFAVAFALCLLLDLNREGSGLVLVLSTFPLGLVVFMVYFIGNDSANYSHLQNLKR